MWAATIIRRFIALGMISLHRWCIFVLSDVYQRRSVYAVVVRRSATSFAQRSLEPLSRMMLGEQPSASVCFFQLSKRRLLHESPQGTASYGSIGSNLLITHRCLHRSHPFQSR
jgi:hypothetical protein